MDKTRLRIWVTAGLLVSAGMTTSRAFVVSAEKELAKLYPPILRGDLSACAAAAATPVVGAKVAVGRLVARLNGSWELQSRTVRGITVSSASRSARLYFDITPQINVASASGGALFVDRPVAASADGVAAYWAVAVGQSSRRRVSLTMTGESVGSYTYARIRDLNDAGFFEMQNVFVAVDHNAPAANAWDKIVLTERSISYVSCSDRVVERYAKQSTARPLIDGVSLPIAWQRLKRTYGSIGANLGGSVPMARPR